MIDLFFLSLFVHSLASTTVHRCSNEHVLQYVLQCVLQCALQSVLQCAMQSIAISDFLRRVQAVSVIKSQFPLFTQRYRYQMTVSVIKSPFPFPSRLVLTSSRLDKYTPDMKRSCRDVTSDSWLKLSVNFASHYIDSVHLSVHSLSYTVRTLYGRTLYGLRQFELWCCRCFIVRCFCLLCITKNPQDGV